MRKLARLCLFSSTIAALFIACGSRTGLPIDDLEATTDATVDVGHDVGIDAHDAAPDVHDATLDAPPDRGVDAPPDNGVDAPPIEEGGPLDAKPDCEEPAVCDPKDPGKIFKCGVAIFQCSSLEQCQATGSDDSRTAMCVNPCTDTLGQDTSNGCEFYSAEYDTIDSVAARASRCSS